MKNSNWFKFANDMSVMLEDWQRQDDEYNTTMMQLEPFDRTQEQEEQERAKINTTREIFIRQKVLAIPEVVELSQALRALLNLSAHDHKSPVNGCAYCVAKQMLSKQTSL